MKKLLIYAGIAALVMPTLVILIDQFLNDMIVLLFWPGSIMLLSLGAEERPLSTLFYVYSIGIFSNVILYTFLAVIFRILINKMKPENTNME